MLFANRITAHVQGLGRFGPPSVGWNQDAFARNVVLKAVERALDKRQKQLAHRLAEAGAALIWGHHPHALQRADWLETAAGRTLVLYSLGNALFDQGGLDEVRQSALVLVTLKQDGVAAMQAIPFEINLRRSQIIEPEAATKEKILERLQSP